MKTKSASWVFSFCLIILINPFHPGSYAQGPMRPVPMQFPEEGDRVSLEREIDKIQMMKIYSALKRYEKDKGTLPDWLSDLVPDYIDDPSVFLSPLEARTGVSRLYGSYDPVLHVSYIYEFNGKPATTRVELQKNRNLTMKSWKILQVAEFGPVVPILRCHLHRPVLNVSYNGVFFQTGTIWETDPMTIELMERFGIPEPGAGIKKVEVQVQSGVDEKPLEGVALQITDRVSELSQLPPLLMITDKNGVCRVPLGFGYPIHYKISVQSDDWACLPVEWNQGNTPEPPEKIQLKVMPAVSVGGKFMARDGRPVSNAIVIVNGIVRDDTGQVVEHRINLSKTGSNGAWSVPGIPEGLEELAIRLLYVNGRDDYFIVGRDDSSGDYINIDELYGATAEVAVKSQ